VKAASRCCCFWGYPAFLNGDNELTSPEANHAADLQYDVAPLKLAPVKVEAILANHTIPTFLLFLPRITN